MSDNRFAITVYGDTIDELSAALAEALAELSGDEDEADEPTPAKKSKPAKAAAPVEDDDDDEDFDDEDDDSEDDDDDLDDYTESDLKSKGIADLRKIAEDEFEVDSKGLKKAELIEAILEAQDEDSDDDDDDDLDDDDEDEDDDDGDDDEGYTLEELQELDLAELKALAKEEGVSYGPRTKREKLEAALFEVVGVEDDD
jgi:hypothetical protein